MSETVVQTHELSRRFGRTQALNQVSLQVERGQVYGLVGANGAGKTTLIRHILGLLQAQQGSVRVFGRDPVREPVEVLRRIGYLSEERELPEWMQVAELLRYTQAYYSSWDWQYAGELMKTFDLEPHKKVKQLSKGMRAQAGLIAAVAHRPELLLLDEPSTGLDALVRKDILNAIVRMVADEGRTVLFSSHLLDEVELMSDYIFMVHGGQLILEGGLDDLKGNHQVLVAHLPADFPESLGTAGILEVQQLGAECRFVCSGPAERLEQQIAELGGTLISQRCATLAEIFVARVGWERKERREASELVEV